MGAILLSVFGGIIAWMVTRNQGTTDSTSTAPKTAPRQNISSIARQGFRQGNAESVSTKRTEGAAAIVGPQGSKIIDDTIADLNDRIDSATSPEWNMRFLNAKHRMVTQKNVNEGNPPPLGSSVVIPRVDPYVADDSGPASSFTRTQFTWQRRFRVNTPAPINAAPVNPQRRLDQNDDADQTAIVTLTTGPNGAKSVIYPRDWSEIPRQTPDQRPEQGKRSYNYAKTPQPMPRQKVPMHNQTVRNQWGSRKAGNG